MIKWILFLGGIFFCAVSAHAHGHVGEEIYDKLFDRLALLEDKNIVVWWIMVPLALLYGVIHALGPGHGKFVVISYFSSHNARYVRGIIAGIQIALVHVVSAITIVLVMQKLSQTIFDDASGLRFMKLISYAIITMLGLFMLLRHSRKCSCSCCCHEHGAAHNDKKTGWLLALGVGLIPCPSILAFLFYTMSKQMLGTGIMLVFCMSAGMALALCVIGIASIFASKKLIVIQETHNSSPKFANIIRRCAAGMIACIGLVMFILELS
jgi:ABC-type nickel/cobalt efflux system permease component RcnA